jgi:polar amino acid transport system substrate-binding protein
MARGSRASVESEAISTLPNRAVNRTIRCIAAIALVLGCTAAGAAAPELVMLAPSNHTMPIASFKDGELNGGILKDLGDAIGARVGREVRFVSVPSRRVGLVLSQGFADGVCLVQPHWIDGSFDWTAAIIPSGGVVLARADAPPIQRLSDLRGKKIGTVAGYRYQLIEPVLGKEFLRDDGPSGEHTLRKLMAGRTQYALMEASTAAWHVRNDRSLRLDITYESTKARCAFSKLSKVPFADIKRATDKMDADGSVDKIMARYR